jgi:hypothetical protein
MALLQPALKGLPTPFSSSGVGSPMPGSELRRRKAWGPSPPLHNHHSSSSADATSATFALGEDVVRLTAMSLTGELPGLGGHGQFDKGGRGFLCLLLRDNVQTILAAAKASLLLT